MESMDPDEARARREYALEHTEEESFSSESEYEYSEERRNEIMGFYDYPEWD